MAHHPPSVLRPTGAKSWPSPAKNVRSFCSVRRCQGPISRRARRTAVHFRNLPRVFCLLLCTNALAMYVVSHPISGLLVTTLAYSLLLQIAYIGSVFLLACLAVFAEMSKALSSWVFSMTRDPKGRYKKPRPGVWHPRASPHGPRLTENGLGKGTTHTGAPASRMQCLGLP